MKQVKYFFMISIKKLINSFRAFALEKQGVAAVEFALILPIMLLIYLGTAEASRAISYHNRIVSIASSMGDLIAQEKNDISIATLRDYFSATQTLIAPYTSTGVNQILTSVYVRPNGSTRVEWSFRQNGSRGYNTGSSFSLPANIRNVSRDNYVIVSEASLNYQPMVNYIFPSGIQFYQKFYNLTRGSNGININ